MQTMTPRYSRTLQALTMLASAPALLPGRRTAASSDSCRCWSDGVNWPVNTRAHIDLWLHGFALLSDDTGRVPMFKRGYASRIARASRAATCRRRWL